MLNLDNREVSLAFWLAIAVTFMVAKRELRSALINLVRSFFAWRLAIVWVLLTIYVWCETRLLGRMGIWDDSHLKATIVWGVTVAVVAFTQLAAGRSLVEMARQNFTVTVVVDFLVNLYVFRLIVELLFVPFMFLLGGLLGVAEGKDEYRTVVRPLRAMTMAVGMGLIGHAAYNIYFHFSSFASIATAKTFAIPPILSLLFVPFLYIALLIFRYERLLNLVKFVVKDQTLAKFLRRQAIRRGGWNAATLERWSRQLPAAAINSKEDALEFLSRPVQPAATPPSGFRSLRWGDPPPPGMRRLAGPTSDGCELYAQVPNSPFVGLSVVEEAFSFSRTGFFSGTVWLEGSENFESAKIALRRAYGPPTFRNDKTSLWKWSWADAGTEIELYRQSSPSGRTSVTFRRHISQ